MNHLKEGRAERRRLGQPGTAPVRNGPLTMAGRYDVGGGLVLLAALAAGGCYYGGPPRVHPPSISPTAAGRGAIEQYDMNKDGVIGGEELERAPSLKAAIRQLDSSGDGGVSADEVADRVKAWQESKVGKMSATFLVTVDGRPLSGASVTFEPEKFLGREIQACCGTSDEAGVINLRAEPKYHDEVEGAACGLYLVRVSKRVEGQELLPARYNAETTLGREIALDAEGMHEAIRRLELTSQ